MNDRAASPEPPVGATLRRLADAALKLLATRIELASVELAQAQRSLVRWFALCLGAGLLLLLAATAATAAIVIALWDMLGWLGLAIFALAYAAAALALVARVRREFDAAPGVLSATVAELKEDLAQLQRPGSTPPPAPDATAAR
jgi:uncharacterized membrane protein YqjE